MNEEEEKEDAEERRRRRKSLHQLANICLGQPNRLFCLLFLLLAAGDDDGDGGFLMQGTNSTATALSRGR